MYYVYFQDTDKIEMVLSGEIAQEEYQQVMHQLESLSVMYPNINVLLDTTEVSGYDVAVFKTELDFFTRYKQHLDRIAIVTSGAMRKLALETVNRMVDTDIRVFEPKEIEAARKWIFPSRLPA